MQQSMVPETEKPSKNILAIVGIGLVAILVVELSFSIVTQTITLQYHAPALQLPTKRSLLKMIS